MAGKDDQGAELKAEPSSNNKMLFIIGGAVLAVVIVVVAVLLLSGKGGKTAKTEPAEAEKGEKHGEGGAKGAVAGVYPMDPFIVNIYDGQELRYLKVKVEFETAGPTAKEELDLRQAPLRDAILVLLTTKTLQDIQDLQGKNQLREEILAAVTKIVAAGRVSKVYFTDFVVQ
jgi:flagellar FliL protein